MSEEVTTLEQFAQNLASNDEEVEPAQPDEEAIDEDQQEDAATEEPEEGEIEQAEDQPETASVEDQVIEWETASGDKFSEPVSELKQGYMRNRTFTQSMQELARERETAHQQIQQQFSQVEQYAQELGALSMQNATITQLEAYIGQINRNDDPVAYNAAVNELLMTQRKRDGLAAQISQIQQGRTFEQQQAFAAAQKQAAAELASGPNALPNFGPELVKQMNATGHEYGLTDQDLATITDPRHIRILHDAMQYRALQAKKPGVVNKVKQAPQKPAKQTASRPAGGLEKDIKQFQGKGDLNSFARLLQHTL